jgi:hypothetical protein
MPRVEGQRDGAPLDRRSIADVIERLLGPDPDADLFAQLVVDAETETISVDRLVVRYFQMWKRDRARQGSAL